MLALSFSFILEQGIFAGEYNTSQKIWANSIRGKAANAVLDEHEVIEMMLFSAQAKTGITARAAAITSVMYQTKAVQATKGPLPFSLLLQRATLLKGGALSAAEEKDLNQYYSKLVRQYVDARPGYKPGRFVMDITYGLGDVRNLQKTIKPCATIADAVKHIAFLHGYKCSFSAKDKGYDFVFVKEAIDRNVPVILQDDTRILLCFGYTVYNSQPHLIFCEPINVPFTKTHCMSGKEDLESIDPFVVASRKVESLGPKFTTDYGITSGDQIPNKGFYIEPFVKDKYKAYVLMDWRRSAEAHDDELRKLLKLSTTSKVETAKLPDTPTDKELWDYYILGRDEMLSGPYILVPSVIFSTSGLFTSQYASLFSSICTRKGVAVGKFTLPLGKFYRAACKVLNDDYLLLKGDRRKKMELLSNTIHANYIKKQRDVESYIEDLSDPYLVAALRMKSTMAPTANIVKGLRELELLHGWKARLETSESLPLAKYKEALHKRIPIVLKSNEDNAWSLCIGYLRHNDKDYLLIADPALLIGGKTLHIDNQRLYPGAGISFELFDKKRYTPYIIHGWHISVDAYKKEIMAVFGKN
jgi:hypothetical protein